jgi:hypothetical protein
MASKKSSSRAKKKTAAASAKKRAPAKRGKSAAPSSKTAGKKTAAKTTGGKKTQSAGSGKQPLVTKQPQSKQQAALQHHMFLHEDDAWSLAYFNSNDLHFVERQLFG